MATQRLPEGPLTRVAEVLWPADTPERHRLRAASGRSPSPGAERYAAVPSSRRARYLLPLDAPPAVRARLLLHYNHLRTDRRRAQRLAIAALAALGLPRTDRSRLVAEPGPRGGLRELVAEQLGCRTDELVLSVGVRPGTGPLAPTVTVVDTRGRPRVFVKVAADPGTRAELEAEHDVLAALAQPRGSGLLVPGPMFRVEWEGALVVGIDPLPLDVRRIGPDELDATLPFLERLVAQHERESLRLVDSPWTARLRAVLSGLPERWAGPLGHALDQAARRHPQPVPHGLRHGDWSCWNMAWSATVGGLAVWDWEYSEPMAPLGLDRCNWHFAFDTSVRGLSPAEATDRLREDARARGDHSRTAELFLLDMAVRRAALGADGEESSAAAADELVTLVRSRR